MNASQRYRESLKAVLERAFEEQSECLEQAAQILADCAQNGKMIYTFGTGHGHLLALEIFYRAGGLVRVCPVLDERLMLHISASESTQWERNENMADELLKKYPIGNGDVLICISNSGRNATPVEMAIKCRNRGVKVIALTSLAHSASATSRNITGKRLFEVADLVLDNMGVPGDAIVEGTCGRMIGPTSTTVGAALLQSIVCRVEEIARERGFELECFASSNIDGGDAINEKYLERYRGVIQGL